MRVHRAAISWSDRLPCDTVRLHSLHHLTHHTTPSMAPSPVSRRNCCGWWLRYPIVTLIVNNSSLAHGRDTLTQRLTLCVIQVSQAHGSQHPSRRLRQCDGLVEEHQPRQLPAHRCSSSTCARGWLWPVLLHLFRAIRSLVSVSRGSWRRENNAARSPLCGYLTKRDSHVKRAQRSWVEVTEVIA
jgi:hypothetical protein